MNIRFNIKDRGREAAPGRDTEAGAAANENPQPAPSRWPLLVIGIGALLTVLWLALLGWGAFKMAGATLL